MDKTIDTKEFRNALGSFVTGVTIVTTRGSEGSDVGVTANSFNSVSLDPPLVLWSLAKTSRNIVAFEECDHFNVHILASDQEPLSNLFAKKGADKFTGLNVQRGLGETPLLEGCSARFQCKTAYRYEGGDHIIIVGEVQRFESFERAPLAFMGGRYAYTLLKPQGASGLKATSGVEAHFDHNWLSYLIRRTSYQYETAMRPMLHEHNLDEVMVYILLSLIAEGGQSLSQLEFMLIGFSQVVVRNTISQLIHRSLINSVAFDADEAGLSLTEQGRNIALRFLAISKSHDEDAGQGLEHAELLQLKELLCRVIENTKPATKLTAKQLYEEFHVGVEQRS